MPFTEDQMLPRFRRDLKLYQGPDAEDGSPTYNLYDPISAQYFQIGWAESLIFQHLRPGMTAGRLISEIEKRAPIKVTLAEIEGFFLEAAQLNLLESKRQSDQILKESESKKLKLWKWAVLHYLYLRIPLINPDAFLERTLPYVRWLVSTPALILYVILILLGAIQLVGRFDEFLHTFPYFFSLEGIITYALAITAVKVIHEFAHAYVAKAYGVHVPTMGVAFLVLWPVLYTDITDSWKLSDRRQRLAITCAGVSAELIVAGLATLGWALSDPGLLQSVFFVIASITWVTSLLINLNPAMRFDGYYLLSDLWGIDNLHARSFATARWQLRKWLLGFQVPPPEPLPFSRRMGILVFSIYTWLYRLILYTTIAVFVYFQFTKTLGIFLVLVEIYYFILAPFVSEGQQLYRMRAHFTANIRLKLTLAASGLFLFWFLVPLPHTERFPAITSAADYQVLYVPYDSVVKEIFVKRGEEVKKGDPILTLASQEINSDIAKVKLEIAMVDKQILILEKEEKDRAFLPQKKAEQSSLQARLEGLLRVKKQLSIESLLNGTVAEWDPLLRPNEAVEKDQVLGRVFSSGIEVVCFVPEGIVTGLSAGQKVSFVLLNPHQAFRGEITQIDPVRSNVLTYPPLASIYGGQLPVTEGVRGQLELVETYYAVKVKLEQTDYLLRVGQPGEVEASGPWRSKLGNLFRTVQQVFWRESGF